MNGLLHVGVNAASACAPDDPMLLMMHRDVHPFGKELGTIDTYFSSWSPKPPDSSAFDVPGIDKCAEGQGAQCQNAMEDAFKFFRK